MRRLSGPSYIEVVGPIWMPFVTGATRYTLTDYDVDNIERPINRENVAYWLALHSGDFRYVEDFSASIEGVEIPWADEENEMTYVDCMYPTNEPCACGECA